MPGAVRGCPGHAAMPRHAGAVRVVVGRWLDSQPLPPCGVGRGASVSVRWCSGPRGRRVAAPPAPPQRPAGSTPVRIHAVVVAAAGGAFASSCVSPGVAVHTPLAYGVAVCCSAQTVREAPPGRDSNWRRVLATQRDDRRSIGKGPKIT